MNGSSSVQVDELPAKDVGRRRKLDFREIAEIQVPSLLTPLL